VISTGTAGGAQADRGHRRVLPTVGNWRENLAEDATRCSTEQGPGAYVSKEAGRTWRKDLDYIFERRR
jgi:hypothetical protein